MNNEMLYHYIGLRDFHDFVNLQRYMFTISMFSTVITTNSHDYSLKMGCSRNRPLIVIFSHDSRTLEVLRQLRNLSALRWLLLYNGLQPIGKLLETVNIPFDCEFLVAQYGETAVALMEVYRITKDQPLQTYPWGNWSPQTGLNTTAEEFFTRRSNLKGHVFKAAAVQNPPITIIQEDMINVTFGFVGNLWSELEQLMNFTTNFFYPKDGAWGSVSQNNSWNGMIHMVMQGQVDVAVNDFTMTENRSFVIDFTIPVFSSKQSLFIRHPIPNLGWTNFLKPFSIPLWLAVAVSGVVLATAMAGANSLESHHVADVWRCSLYDALHVVLGIFCFQGHSTTIQSTSSWIIYYMANLIAIVVMAAYSASLISHLANQNIELPFTGLRGLLEDGTYELGVTDKSSKLNMFDMSSDGLLQQLYLHHMNKDHLPLNALEGLERACSDPKYAYMGTKVTADYLMGNASCPLVSIVLETSPEVLSIVLPKRSPFRRLINHNILKMYINGALMRIHENVWPQMLPSEDQTLPSVTLEEVLPILSVLAFGLGIAVAFLLAERIMSSSLAKSAKYKMENVKTNFRTLAEDKLLKH